MNARKVSDRIEKCLDRISDMNFDVESFSDLCYQIGGIEEILLSLNRDLIGMIEDDEEVDDDE